MLELFFVFHITLLGLAYWTMRFLRLQNIGANGITYFLSIPLLACALYVLNAGFSVGLIVSSRVVIGVALLGLIFLLADRREIKSWLTHPIFYLLPLVCLFFALGQEMNYQPTEWDEYGQWLGRPMTMVLDNSILNPARHGYGRGGFDYTPGAALLLIYKDLVLGQNLSIGPLIAVPLILFLSLLCAGYDFIKQLAPKSFFLPEVTLLAGIVMFMMTLMGGRFFPVNLLIESFQNNILIATGLCFYWVSNGGVSRRSGVAILGILSAYAYLVKTATILLLPGLVAALILHQLSAWRAEQKKEPIKALFKRLSMETFILAVPAVCIVVHFGLLTSKYEKTIHLWTVNSLSYWRDRAYLMPKMWTGVGDIVFENHFITLIMIAPLAGYLWGLRNKEQRYLTMFVFSFCALHLLLVVWLFRTMFDVSNAENLASFSRYFSTAQVPYVFFGLLLLCINLLVFFRSVLRRYRLSHFVVNGYKGILAATGLVLVATWGVAFGSQYAQKIRAIPFDPIPYKLNTLLQYINANNLNSLRVHVIAQGSDTTEIVKIHFYANRKDVFQRDISFAGGRSLYTERVQVWDEVESRESTKKKLSEVDVIWIEKSDERINNILAEITNPATCPLPLKNYFLFKGADGRFECRSLQNPTYANCNYLMLAGERKSGIYEMDPDGFGPLPIIKTRCQMDVAGGWTLVASISDKSRDHINPNAVQKDEFYLEGKFGKLSDSELNRLANFQEYLLECGEGDIRKIFIKDHAWRSDENDHSYHGLYSIDQKHWFPFHERGALGWYGFDNYTAVFEGGADPKSFMAYSAEQLGCYSQSNGDRPAKGALWVR